VVVYFSGTTLKIHYHNHLKFVDPFLIGCISILGEHPKFFARLKRVGEDEPKTEMHPF
jgi:hypothetical protein